MVFSAAFLRVYTFPYFFVSVLYNWSCWMIFLFCVRFPSFLLHSLLFDLNNDFRLLPNTTQLLWKVLWVLFAILCLFNCFWIIGNTWQLWSLAIFTWSLGRLTVFTRLSDWAFFILFFLLFALSILNNPNHSQIFR